MLKSRYHRRLALLEAKHGIGPNGLTAKTAFVICNDGLPRPPSGPAEDDPAALAAEVRDLERRRQELKAEIGASAG